MFDLVHGECVLKHTDNVSKTLQSSNLNASELNHFKVYCGGPDSESDISDCDEEFTVDSVKCDQVEGKTTTLDMV